jgi:demethylmenaquinone methyltransferase/2-methoxy-6-polyprenyl-1,4-benzoquinol methylase
VNLVSSLGFCRRWRRQCVRAIPIRRGDRILDLMTGMGEIIPDAARRTGEEGEITAIDFSARMCREARRHTDDRVPCSVRVIEADVLAIELPPGSVDAVLSTFGLKTLSVAQLRILARRVSDVLATGGRLSLLEISVPRSRWLRIPYLFYLRRVIPLIGAMFLGNPENYRWLGVYTEAFGDCSDACRAFSEAGLEVEMASYFFGCATGIVGRKP